MPDLHIIKYISVAELTTKHFWTGPEKLIMFFVKKNHLAFKASVLLSGIINVIKFV